MLLVIATLLPHPFQNIVMHLTLEKQQLQQQLTLILKKLCLKPTHCPRLYNTVKFAIHLETATSAFWGAFIIPPILAAMFFPTSIWLNLW